MTGGMRLTCFGHPKKSNRKKEERGADWLGNIEKNWSSLWGFAEKKRGENSKERRRLHDGPGRNSATKCICMLEYVRNLSLCMRSLVCPTTLRCRLQDSKFVFDKQNKHSTRTVTLSNRFISFFSFNKFVSFFMTGTVRKLFCWDIKKVLWVFLPSTSSVLPTKFWLI